MYARESCTVMVRGACLASRGAGLRTKLGGAAQGPPMIAVQSHLPEAGRAQLALVLRRGTCARVGFVSTAVVGEVEAVIAGLPPTSGTDC